MGVGIGVDAHKRTHTSVALDEVGRTLGERTIAATDDGHLEALVWARQWPQVRFAVEYCRHVTRRLERDLLGAGREVVPVKTQLMTTARRTGRQSDKSDAIDTRAVVMAALREPDLPVARLHGPTREVKLLSDHRRDLVRGRTRLANRVRWHLHELDPELEIPARGLRCYHVTDALLERVDRLDGVVARITRDLLERCRELTEQVNALQRELARRVALLAPSLLAAPGCGALSAAMIVGETVGASRFRSKHAYARFNGTAPLPVWSARVRVRLNRGGNLTVNSAGHAIAITQARGHGPGQAYLAKLQAAGKTRTEALRLVRRRLSDRAFAALLYDERQSAAASGSVEPTLRAA